MLRFDDLSVNSNILNSVISDSMNSAFDLDNDRAYRDWRRKKLSARPRESNRLLVQIDNPNSLSAGELTAVRARIDSANMALLQCTNPTYINKESLARLGTQLGLGDLDDNLCADEDAISTLSVDDQKPYIPYTNRPLSWHTDGYYNEADRQVLAWTLMCRSDAEEGGENQLLDHELLYILLRDHNPSFVRALMDPDAMTIPANRMDGRELRPARSGPVFSLNPSDGSLHMRYSARARNIQWKADPDLQAALRFIEHLFSRGHTYIYRLRLQPGQCLVSNNVLHNRSGFRDSPEHRRVIYRARYHQRVNIPGFSAST